MSPAQTSSRGGSMDYSESFEITSMSTLIHVKYVHVASMAILVYDYFLTFDREKNLIWGSKWGIGKVLFFIARYPTFICVALILYHSTQPDIPPHRCLSIYYATIGLADIGEVTAEAILLLRTYALYIDSSKVRTFLVTLFVLINIPNVIIIILYLHSVQFGPPAIQTMVGCFLTAGSKIVFADLVLLMAVETIIVCLTLYKGIKTIRTSRSPLVKAIYGDGLLYFIYIFFITAGNISVLVVGPPEIAPLFHALQLVMHSVFSTRIMLHVRDAARNEDLNITVSSIVFANPKGRI